MVPCGVPEVTYDQSEQDPIMTTRCLRPTKKCLSQVSKTTIDAYTFQF